MNIFQHIRDQKFQSPFLFLHGDVPFFLTLMHQQFANLSVNQIIKSLGVDLFVIWVDGVDFNHLIQDPSTACQLKHIISWVKMWEKKQKTGVGNDDLVGGFNPSEKY